MTINADEELMTHARTHVSLPPSAVARPPAARRPSAAAGPRAARDGRRRTLDGKKVAVEYGRPALSGRTMARPARQLPADRVWRAGVDQVTTLTTEADITDRRQAVPAGKYTLYLHAPATGDYALRRSTPTPACR